MASNKLTSRRQHVDRPPVCKVSLPDTCPPAEVIAETVLLSIWPAVVWTLQVHWLIRPPASSTLGKLEVIVNHGQAVYLPLVLSDVPFDVHIFNFNPGAKLWARLIIRTDEGCIYLGHAFARAPLTGPE